MNSALTAKFNMYKSVVAYFTENITIVNSIPALLSSFTTMTGIISLISGNRQQVVQSVKGASAVKRKSLRALVRIASMVASKVYAYAVAAGDEELKRKVNFSNTGLVRAKYGELSIICRNILDAANANLAALMPYNVTESTLNSFMDHILAYEALEPHPRNTVSERSAHNKEMNEQFQTVDDLLRQQVDKIMSEFIDTDPKFYNTYMSNRVIIDPAAKRTQIKGKVINTLNQKPIYGATITITENGQTITTTPDGKYVMKPTPPGTYTVTISRPGFVSQTVTEVVIVRGAVTRLNFQLEGV